MAYDENMQHKRSSYQTLLISKIPVTRQADGFVTDPLWSLDINTNAKAIAGIRLVCPVQNGDGAGCTPLDPQIEVTAADTLTSAQLEELVRAADIVELPGNFGWHASGLARRAMRLARQYGKLSVLGISSNRAKTTMMNAKGRPLPSRLRAWLRAQSIKISQRYLVRNCDAVRVVGPGLRPLVEDHARNLSVEIASWIRTKDILPPRDGLFDPVHVVIASRLEPMKGVAIGVEAVAGLITAGQNVTLNLIGIGAEEARLKQIALTSGINDRTVFSGQLAYPEPFFQALRNADFVLLTNLNDEQPRLIFDAIAQGAIPVCPRHPAYKALNLDPRVLYEQGSATDLRETLSRLVSLSDEERKEIRVAMIKVAQDRTLESMHARRRDWVLSLLSENAAPLSQSDTDRA